MMSRLVVKRWKTFQLNEFVKFSMMRVPVGQNVGKMFTFCVKYKLISFEYCYMVSVPQLGNK